MQRLQLGAAVFVPVREPPGGEYTVIRRPRCPGQVATAVGILYDGRIVVGGPPADPADRMEAREDPTLEDVFLSVTTEDGLA
ncbi:hypothetical protein [Halosimplex marinum]|uniref:hypothetical protein n=1 Tax=Halosimplex marinum TaxID=3396620 RepID=UPI003F54EA9C